MTREELRRKFTDSILSATSELEEIQEILMKENLPNQEVYILESEHAASLYSTINDTLDQINTLKGRI